MVLASPPLGELTLEIHRSLASAEHSWLAFEPHAQGHPYQRFHWQSLWDRKIRTDDEEPFIVVLRDCGVTRMLLPLVIERHLGMSRLVPMGAPVCDYHAPLIDQEIARRLDPQLTHRLLMAIAAEADVDYVLLTHIPPMLGAARNPFSMLGVRPFSVDAHAMPLGTEWNAMYEARRSAKTRARLRTKENVLARFGSIVFTEVNDPQERLLLAMEMMALKASQLEPTAGEFNVFSRPDVQAFFQTLALEASSEDAFLFKLTVAGDLAAAALGLVRHGCFYYQVPVYADSGLQRYSPGHLLLLRLMEWAIDRGCTRFDFTLGDESYKAEWCNETWPLACGAWARTVRGRVGAALALAQVAAVRRIKKQRTSYALAVRIRTALGAIERSLRAPRH